MNNETTSTASIANMQMTYTYVTCNIGWTGGKRHIAQVVTNNGDTEKIRPLCADAFRWDGTRQATYVKNEAPTTKNVTCKKCLDRL